MNNAIQQKARWDQRRYAENRSKFTFEELLPYANQWVAWSLDGSRVVAHHEDLAEVARMVEATGLEREEVVFDLRPPAEEGAD